MQLWFDLGELDVLGNIYSAKERVAFWPRTAIRDSVAIGMICLWQSERKEHTSKGL